MGDFSEVIRREKAVADAREAVNLPPGFGGRPHGEPQVMVPPIPIIVGEVQIRPDTMNIGVTPDGKKVVQFIQGPTTFTVLLEEVARKGLIKGLTGVEVVGG